MSITRANDVKLKVLPFLSLCEHKYYYEGPCRFGKGEALEPGFDSMVNAHKQKEFLDNLQKFAGENIEVMEPAVFKRTDDWDNHESEWDSLTDAVNKCDVVVGSCGIASDDRMVEFATRFDKPIIISPDSFASNLGVPAAIRALTGEHEAYGIWRWEQLTSLLATLRARKVMHTTRVLLATRFGSPVSQSSLDSFNSYEKITAKLGVHFRFVNIHELLDQMTPAQEGGNYTTPGRKTLDLTEEDMAEAEKLADELMGTAEYVNVDRDYLLKSLYAYITVRKHMDDKDCCGFTAPCPDVCSTRRLNEMQFTFCLTHSLNMEQGIPSGCEFDVNGIISMQALMAVSGKFPFLGNTEPLTWAPDGQAIVLGADPKQTKVLRDRLGDDTYNVYFMQHSVPHRRIKDPNTNSKFALQHFAFDQKFGATMRYDFDDDQGTIMTLCRFSPDGEKLMIAKGEVISGDGYELPNCTETVYFRIKDVDEFFKAQTSFGLHMVMVYGDYKQQLIDLAESMNVEPVVVDY